MAWEVRWTEAAADDLEGIGSYIGKDSPSYAAAFIREAIEASKSLGTLAERGRVVPEWSDESVRELMIGNYRLIYQLSGSSTFIIGLVHGSRDLKALWEREGRRR